jgi:hypothetical protein
VSSYTVNGAAGGTFKTVGNLSWLRVFGAGHEVPYYRECFLVVDCEGVWCGEIADLLGEL